MTPKRQGPMYISTVKVHLSCDKSFPVTLLLHNEQKASRRSVSSSVSGVIICV